MNTRNQRVVRAARFAIIANIALVIGKILAGVLAGSVSVLSEAAHSGMDFVVSLLGLVAIGYAMRPADSSHPYGHGKVESLTSLGAGLLIFGVAGSIVWRAVAAFVEGTHVAHIGWGIGVMAISAAVSAATSRYLLRVGRGAGSPALEAMGTELSADVITAIGVVAGLALTRLTGWQWLDPVVGLAVAGVLVVAGVRVLRGAVVVLTDTRLPDEEVAAIRHVLDAHATAFLEYHALRTRHIGGAHAVDLHLVVPHDMSVGAAHDLSTHLEDEIAVALPDTDVTIHLEPEAEAVGALAPVREGDDDHPGDDERDPRDHARRDRFVAPKKDPRQ